MPTDRVTLEKASRGVRPWIVLNDALSALALAEDGHGITLAMSYLTRAQIADGRLVEVLPDHAQSDLPVHLIWPEQRTPAAAVRAFLDSYGSEMKAFARKEAGKYLPA